MSQCSHEWLRTWIWGISDEQTHCMGISDSQVNASRTCSAPGEGSLLGTGPYMAAAGTTCSTVQQAVKHTCEQVVLEVITHLQLTILDNSSYLTNPALQPQRYIKPPRASSSECTTLDAWTPKYPGEGCCRSFRRPPKKWEPGAYCKSLWKSLSASWYQGIQQRQDQRLSKAKVWKGHKEALGLALFTCQKVQQTLWMVIADEIAVCRISFTFFY